MIHKDILYTVIIKYFGSEFKTMKNKIHAFVKWRLRQNRICISWQGSFVFVRHPGKNEMKIVFNLCEWNIFVKQDTGS